MTEKENKRSLKQILKVKSNGVGVVIRKENKNIKDIPKKNN